MRPPGAVIDAAPYLSDADEVFRVQRAARMAELAPLLRAHRDQIKPALAANIEQGIALTGEQVAAAQLKRAEIFGRVRSFLADGRYDVPALPTVQVVPFPVEQEMGDPDQRRADGHLHRLDTLLLPDHGDRQIWPERWHIVPAIAGPMVHRSGWKFPLDADIWNSCASRCG